MLENVFYINLEHRTDRRTQVEEELNTLGWKYERFNAIKLPNGRVGCSMSHLKLIKHAKERNLPYIVVVEDDIQFKNHKLYNKMLDQFLKDEIEYDMLLLAGNLRPPVKRINDYTFQIFHSWTTTGYIVKSAYYDTLIQNIHEGIQHLMRQPEKHTLYAIDSYWMRLQKRDKWMILYPRTVTQRPTYSDIEKREINYDKLMLD
jgi:GR25 family glycosyltransferase involved in LPS biosynthesis